MSEGTAILKLQVQGAQEVLNQLQALHSQLNGMSGQQGPSGMPAGSASPPVQSGGAVVAQTALPPAPGTPPTALSHAAATAGSPGAATVPASTQVQTQAQSGQLPAPAPATPGAAPLAGSFGWKDVGAALGGHHAYQQTMAILNQYAGSYAQSMVAGQPFYAESMMPAGIQLGGTALGGTIGFLLGGPIGAGIGAGVGSAAGGVGSSLAEPQVSRDIMMARYRKLAPAYGYGPEPTMVKPVIDLAMKEMLAGRPLPEGSMERVSGISQQGHLAGLYNFMFGWTKKIGWDLATEQKYTDPSSPEFNIDNAAYYGIQTSGLVDKEHAAQYLGIVNQMRFSPGTIRSLGKLSLENSDKADFAILRANIYSDPDSVVAATALILKENPNNKEAKGLNQAAKRMQETKPLLEGEVGIAAAQAQEAAMSYSLGLKYGGSAGGLARLPAALDAVKRAADAKRREAAMTKDPLIRAQKTAEANALSMQASTMDDGVWDALSQEASAKSGLAIGSASRAFDSALHGGGRYDGLPWEKVSQSYLQSASDLERLMNQKSAAGKLTPAERMQMQNQIEDLRFKGTEGVARDKEQMRNRTWIGETALTSATEMAKGAHGFFFGSASEQAGIYDAQLKALQEREKVLNRILEQSQKLTYEEKLQLQTEIQQVRVAEEQAKAQSAVAKAQAARAERDTANYLGTYGPRLSLMRGAGGLEASDNYAELYQASQRSISSLEQYRADLIRQGKSPKSPEVMEADRQLVEMKLSAESQLQSMAVMPESAKDRVTRSNLNLTGQVMEAGFGGSPGAVRANLMNQIRLNEKRLRDLAANRSRLMGQGTWSDEMEARFVEASNAVRGEQLGLAVRYDQGWQENLISEAFNMSGQGRLAMAQFTKREASLRGLFLPSMGGTEEQTREMRIFPTRFMQMAGMGSAQGFNARALGMSGSNKIELEITLKDEKGVTLKKNTSQIDNFRNAMDLTFNRSAADTPSG